MKAPRHYVVLSVKDLEDMISQVKAQAKAFGLPDNSAACGVFRAEASLDKDGESQLQSYQLTRIAPVA